MFSLSHPISIAIVLLACTAVYLMHLAFRSRNKVPLPPGPRKIPILGNVHMLPFEGQEHTFAEWGKRYGDVIYAKLFRRTTIIVNSFNASRDLMDKRSGNYSDRPPFILLGMMGWEKVLNLLPYGDEFRKQRKWVQDAFQSKKSLQNYRPLQQRAVVELLNRLLDNPDSFDAHFTRYLASIIMEITYGHRVVNEDDKFVGIAERATTETALIGSAGSMLVDFFPILKHFPSWMPGGRFKKKVTHARKCIRDMYDVPYNMVREKMALGVAWPSFTSSLLEECITGGRLSRNDEDSIKGAAANLYGGGTETTATVLTIFVLLMVTHPHMYKRLQEEMDKVIGSERLPDFDDRPHLPFLDATIKETLRWHTPVPLGVPHNSMKEDIYRQYRIPANSMIISNIWAMSQDTDFFSSPELFLPERYMDDTAILNPKEFVFGFGRRRCPGVDFADANLFIVIANMIATMDISKAKDNDGQEITPPYAFTSGFVSRSYPFRCHIAPRTAKAESLIRQMRIATESVEA